MGNLSLKAGTCVTDITPKLPAILSGQYYKRTAREVFTPLKVTVLAMEANGDSVIFAACDLLGIPSRLTREVRASVAAKNAGIDVEKIILSATHIHTGPFIYTDDFSHFWGDDFIFEPVVDGVPIPSYADFLIETLTESILSAWESRVPVFIRSGSDYCPIAFPRRVVYNDGSAKMYGSAAHQDFSHMEGSADIGIHFMGIFTDEDKLLCAVMNPPCPAQILEHKHFITADYWDTVRTLVADQYGEQAAVLPLLGAAGDLSPRDLVRLARDEHEMYQTPMYNVEGTHIVASRIMRCFNDFMERKNPNEETPVLNHLHAVPELPIWKVTQDEYASARNGYDKLRSRHQSIDDFTEEECMILSLHMGIINRYKLQESRQTHPVEVHCVRIGGTVIVTNPFELYVEYADRIRARAGRLDVIIAQLACSYDGYLPTRTAVEHGGYSAFVANGILGPEGGDLLVEETLKLIRALCD